MTLLTDDQELTLSLVVTPARVGVVRGEVRERLADWRCPQAEPAVSVVVSELLANVAVHTDGRCTLRLWRSGDVLHLTVSDTSTDPPRLLDPAAMSESGRGMRLVQALTLSWKAVVTSTGKHVHCRLPVQPCL